MTRGELFVLAAHHDWDPARIETALREWLTSPDGQTALARAPHVYDDATGQMRPRTVEEAVVGLLDEVAGEKRRRGLSD